MVEINLEIHSGWTEWTNFSEHCQQMQRPAILARQFIEQHLKTRAYQLGTSLSIRGVLREAQVASALQEFCKRYVECKFCLSRQTEYYFEDTDKPNGITICLKCKKVYKDGTGSPAKIGSVSNLQLPNLISPENKSAVCDMLIPRNPLAPENGSPTGRVPPIDLTSASQTKGLLHLPTPDWRAQVDFPTTRSMPTPRNSRPAPEDIPSPRSLPSPREEGGSPNGDHREETLLAPPVPPLQTASPPTKDMEGNALPVSYSHTLSTVSEVEADGIVKIMPLSGATDPATEKVAVSSDILDPLTSTRDVHLLNSAMLELNQSEEMLHGISILPPNPRAATLPVHKERAKKASWKKRLRNWRRYMRSFG